MTNCQVRCQRAALHFDDDSQWHGAFDPLPSFVNKEYTLIDAAHIMAVWELAGEKKTRLSCWKAPCLCCWRPSWRKALLSCFQHLTLYNAYYGSLPCTQQLSILCHVQRVWFKRRLINTHGYLKAQTSRIQIGLVTVMCWNEPSVLITHTMWHGKVEWGSALINHNGW